MGLFDSTYFDPSSYNGNMSGGLLSYLAEALKQQAGAPQDQGPQPTMITGGAGPMPVPTFGQAPTTTLSAQSVQPQAAQAQAQYQQPAPSSDLPPMFQQQSNTGLGAGFRGFMANAHTGPVGAILGGIAGLTGQGMGNPAQVTYQALVQAGVPEPVARAAAVNPEVLKTIAPQIYSKPDFGIVGESPVGKQYGFIDKVNQTINGQHIGGGSGAGTSSSDFLAPGVKQENTSLSGEDYLKQYSPAIQAAVKSYIAGDVMPTGNPRNQAVAAFAKNVAQKYGQDIGIPVNDQTFAEKRKMQTEIASSGQGTMGGILSNGKSAFEHLLNYSNKLAELGNYSGPDVPGGGHLGTAANFMANSVAPSPDTKAKIASVNDNGLRYGQESTKFYSATGGGEAERMNALRENNAKTTTAAEQAGFLQTEKELMLGRLRQKEAQIRNTLGDEYLSRHPVFDKDLQSMLDGIDKNIAKLRGTTADQAPSAAPKTSSGVVDYRTYFGKK